MFYTGDWLKDTRCLTPAAKGTWIDLICFAWDAPQRGILSMTMDSFARLLGQSRDEVVINLCELGDLKVIDLERKSNGIVQVTCRRQVREESARESNRYRAEKHRNSQGKYRSNAKVTTPSSYSYSNSYSVTVKNVPDKPSCPDPQKRSDGDVKILPGYCLELAELLKSKILTNNPDSKIADRQVKAWASEADKIVRLDNRTQEQVRYLINWSQSHSFWKTNILSMATLRKQWDRLTGIILVEKEKTNGGATAPAQLGSRGQEALAIIKERQERIRNGG